MARFHGCWALAALALLAGPPGCRVMGALDEHPPTPADWKVLKDRSISLSREAATACDGQVKRFMADSVRAGDSMELLYITDRSAEAARGTFAQSRWAPRAASLQVQGGARRSLIALQDSLRAALDRQDWNDAARQTTICEAIDRVVRSPRKGPHLKLVVASDMGECSALLDIDGRRLAPAEIPGDCERIIRHFGWSPTSLAGAKVYVVYPAARMNAAPPLNDQRVREDFWRELFQRLGANLKSYGPSL